MQRDTLRILVAEDGADLRLLIRHTLEDEGWQVVEAGNGAEALELLAGDRFDVVLLDAMMPVMDGHEACRRIRADPEMRSIPVIFLTAGSQQRLLDPSLGAAGCLLKPFDVDTLCAEILRVLDGTSRGAI